MERDSLVKEPIPSGQSPLVIAIYHWRPMMIKNVERFPLLELGYFPPLALARHFLTGVQCSSFNLFNLNAAFEFKSKR